MFGTQRQQSQGSYIGMTMIGKSSQVVGVVSRVFEPQREPGQDTCGLTHVWGVMILCHDTLVS